MRPWNRYFSFQVAVAGLVFIGPGAQSIHTLCTIMLPSAKRKWPIFNFLPLVIKYCEEDKVAFHRLC